MRTLISRWYLVKLLENQMDGNLYVWKWEFLEEKEEKIARFVKGWMRSTSKLMVTSTKWTFMSLLVNSDRFP